MKINSLYIKDYRLLKDLQIPFGEKGVLAREDYSLTVLAGLNGSGKSTILRALGEIYTAIKADQPCDFDFRFSYELSSGNKVSVDYSNEREDLYIVKVDGEEQKGFDDKYKPQDLVVHTTGLEHLWEEIAVETEDQTVSDDLLNKDKLTSRVQEQPTLPKAKTIKSSSRRPFFLFRNQAAPLFSLCGLLRWQHEEIAEDLISEVFEQLKIKRLVGFSLDFQLHPSLSRYEEFNRLVELCDEHIQQGAMHKLIFDVVKNEKLLPGFVRGKSGFYEAFKDLEELLYPENDVPAVLCGVEIFFETKQLSEDENEEENDIDQELSRDKIKILPFSWLSDGEQNFLSRMAMLTLMDGKDAIILMDEPEVHFNDYWKRKIVMMIDRVLRDSHNHLILSTHSSILLSDAPIGQVIYIEKVDGRATAMVPDIPIYGSDPGRIMINLFDTETTKGEYQHERLKWALENLDDETLRQLQKHLDIGYWYFRIENKLKGK